MGYSKHDAKEQFDSITQQISTEVLTILASLANIKTVFACSKRDQIRLTNLQTWSDRLHIPLEELLAVLLAAWKDKFPRKSNRGIGITFSTLTGVRSYDIVKDYVKKAYPNKENVAVHKQSFIERMLPSDTVEEENDPVEFVLNYADRIKQLRKEDGRRMKKFSRRRWRGNPFVS